MSNNAPMKLIVEHDFYEYDLLFEQTNPSSPKFFKVRGPYIVAEKKNNNNRVYPMDLLQPEVDRFINEMVVTGRALGELNHPPNAQINQEKVCHRITSLKLEGTTWIGESIVLSSSPDGSIKGTPNGDILASILQHGGKPGMSTRGVGLIGESTGRVDKFKLITIDCVSNPSGPGCFVNGILESKDFMIDIHGDVIEQAYGKFENGIANIPTQSTKTDAGSKYMEQLIREFICNINLK